ncbi:MAG: hypothetical protein LH660_00900, partial [Phormidesmis sp. CAN_BIN36]|nr:hypothetical protein [Phormidesmis sp. CAN_BIN36]
MVSKSTIHKSLLLSPMAWALLYGINAQVGRSQSAILPRSAPVAAPQSAIAALSPTVIAPVNPKPVGAIAQQVTPDSSLSLD